MRDESGAPIVPATAQIAAAAQQLKDMAADAGRALTVELWFPDSGKDANDMLKEGTLT